MLATMLQAPLSENSVRVHPHSRGRVLELTAPYILPTNMDLRGIAGVVFKLEQDPEIAEELNALSKEQLKDIRSSVGTYDGKKIKSPDPEGPYRPTFDAVPDVLRKECETLADLFQRHTGAQTVKIWFPSSPARKFHTDGRAGTEPMWRMTFSFVGDQTLWHTYSHQDDSDMTRLGPNVFSVLPDGHTGVLDRDYFAAQGALMFLWNSSNALFHRTPDSHDENRLMVTFDAPSPRRLDCTRSCPFPCRTP